MSTLIRGDPGSGAWRQGKGQSGRWSSPRVGQRTGTRSLDIGNRGKGGNYQGQRSWERPVAGCVSNNGSKVQSVYLYQRGCL